MIRLRPCRLSFGYLIPAPQFHRNWIKEGERAGTPQLHQLASHERRGRKVSGDNSPRHVAFDRAGGQHGAMQPHPAPEAAELVKLSPAKKQARFYRLEIWPDLFGGFLSCPRVWPHRSAGTPATRSLPRDRHRPQILCPHRQQEAAARVCRLAGCRGMAGTASPEEPGPKATA